jgi:uncharacterized membrane protein
MDICASAKTRRVESRTIRAEARGVAGVDYIALARAVHVLAVVVWIGGVSMATSVALPAVRAGELGPDRFSAFHAFERRFVWQARTAVLLTGLSGAYMLVQLRLWDRFQSVRFWWMHAMVCLWLLFAFVLFVAEPLILHRRFERFAKADPDRAFAWLQRAHWALLGLSTVTVLGAVAGSHGG